MLLVVVMLKGDLPSQVQLCCGGQQVFQSDFSVFCSIHFPFYMPGVGLMVRVVGLGSYDPEFKSYSPVELIPGGVNSACHSSEVGKMSARLSCVGVVTCPGLCPSGKETAKAAPNIFPSILTQKLCWSGDPSRIVPTSQGDCLSSTDALHRVWS